MRWWIAPMIFGLCVITVAAAGAPSLPDALANAGSGSGAAGGPVPLADGLPPWFAAAIGGFGSAAYLIAVWVGLVGRADGRDRLLAHFKKLWALKVPLYLVGGGGVALVFQFPEAKLVPIQAFIIGCTWPAVVANYLSGRQSGEGEQQVLETFNKQKEAERLQSLAEAVPAPRGATAATAAELDRLMEVLSKAPEEPGTDGGPGAGTG